MSELRLDDVTVAYRDRTALAGVCLELTQRRIAVVGANGSGKSTFARLLNGLATATSGTVRVHGLDPATQGADLRARVGFVFSNPDAQIVMPTVAEDVAFSLRGRPRAEVAEHTTEALEQLGLTSLADAPAHDLSSGQKQLLALAGVLVRRPTLIVADEPTALLDAANSRRISQHLIDEGDHQLVLVTHDLALAARCEVAIRFEAGRLVDQGEPDTVIAGYERSLA